MGSAPASSGATTGERPCRPTRRRRDRSSRSPSARAHPGRSTPWCSTGRARSCTRARIAERRGSNASAPPGGVEALSRSPLRVMRSRILAGGGERGVFESTDGGAAWVGLKRRSRGDVRRHDRRLPGGRPDRLRPRPRPREHRGRRRFVVGRFLRSDRQPRRPRRGPDRPGHRLRGGRDSRHSAEHGWRRDLVIPFLDGPLRDLDRGRSCAPQRRLRAPTVESLRASTAARIGTSSAPEPRTASRGSPSTPRTTRSSTRSAISSTGAWTPARPGP